MTQERPELPQVHASFLRRALASVTDLILLGVLLFQFLAMVQAFLFAVPMEKRGTLLLVGLSFVGLCYFPGMESSTTMGTLGKRICGIKVSDLSGNRISALRSVARNLLKVLLFLLFPVSIVMILRGARKQALHDWLMGTQVLLRIRG
jgi:uncharacterized RDD family membrane protein YckC